MPNPHTRTRLKHDRLKDLLDYNPSTGEFTWGVDRGHTARAGDIAGTLRHYGNAHMRVITVDGEIWSANRLAWYWMKGEMPPGRLRARNGDLSDTRWSNIYEENATLSDSPEASYQRRYRRARRAMAKGQDPRLPDYHDPRDPRDPRNAAIYKPTLETRKGYGRPDPELIARQAAATARAAELAAEFERNKGKTK